MFLPRWLAKQVLPPHHRFVVEEELPPGVYEVRLEKVREEENFVVFEYVLIEHEQKELDL